MAKGTTVMADMTWTSRMAFATRPSSLALCLAARWRQKPLQRCWTPPGGRVGRKPLELAARRVTGRARGQHEVNPWCDPPNPSHPRQPSGTRTRTRAKTDPCTRVRVTGGQGWGSTSGHPGVDPPPKPINQSTTGISYGSATTQSLR